MIQFIEESFNEALSEAINNIAVKIDVVTINNNRIKIDFPTTEIN